MGVGNFPAELCVNTSLRERETRRTLGQTGAKETRNLLDERLGRQECVVFFGELLDELLVFVKPARPQHVAQYKK
jgi:hypothetical protein